MGALVGSGMMKCAGSVALVTGAGGGIGRASALALAQAGADIVLNDLRWPSGGSEVASQIRALGRKVVEIGTDVSDQKAVEAMFDEGSKTLGPIDILVTSAVYSDREFFHLANMEGFHKTVNVTLWGAFYCLRAFANRLIHIQKPGSAVLISSPHSHIATPSCMAYNMAKAALDQMGRTAAVELIPKHIRVNMIYPGWCDTPGERKFFSEDVLDRSGKSLPMGRLMRPEEVARGVAFLCDPESDSITGSIMSIDGGTQLPWWSKRGTGEF
jgi:glucose 1-dehydrogenase